MTNDDYIKLGRVSYDMWIRNVYENRYDLKRDWPILEFIGRLVESLTSTQAIGILRKVD